MLVFHWAKWLCSKFFLTYSIIYNPPHIVLLNKDKTIPKGPCTNRIWTSNEDDATMIDTEWVLFGTYPLYSTETVLSLLTGLFFFLLPFRCYLIYIRQKKYQFSLQADNAKTGIFYTPIYNQNYYIKTQKIPVFGIIMTIKLRFSNIIERIIKFITWMN